MHVLELPVDAGRGLVGVQHLLQVQRGGHVGDERPQPAGCLADDLVGEPDRHLYSEQIGKQPGHPLVGQELGTATVGDPAFTPGPYCTRPITPAGLSASVT